ncbi:Shedu anti-phage system protein SduA domain-containing protein [Micromonospora sp. NPDC049903]|uniref:Shedu anti-phage system protein SduA domain-containing protein n=1 Tax=Micromonospora sp. NPDC049903 TaxID=3364276 RepID=UPI00378A08C4
MNLTAYTMNWLDGQPQVPRERGADSSEWNIDAHNESIGAVTRAFLSLGRAGSIELAEQVLRDERRHIGGSERISYAQLAAATAVVAGEKGIAMLLDVATSGSFGSWAEYAIEALWLASAGKRLPAEGYMWSVSSEEFPITETARDRARDALDELILSSKENSVLFSKIIGIIGREAIKNQVVDGVNDFFQHVIKVLTAGSIAIPAPLLDTFENLISQDLPEERYQEFLKAHPTVLDPLAAEVIAKHRLGDDYVTDFVIRRHDLRYLVVEIEKPQDRIFTSKNDFSREFTHALGQVLDFQGWVSESGDYARKKMPGIENPQGLLVMGRRSSLTAQQETKLRRWCMNSKTIDVVTFDDLVTSGRRLLKSLHSLVLQDRPRN